MGCWLILGGDGRRVSLVGLEDSLELAIESFIGLSVGVRLCARLVEIGSSAGQFVGGCVDLCLKSGGTVARAFQLALGRFVTGMPLGGVGVGSRPRFAEGNCFPL